MKNIMILAATGLLISSCNKVVNIDLNEADKKIVIEASLYNGEHPFAVNIKNTTDYYGKEQQTTVDDAEVYISTEGGESMVVPAIEKGIYAVPSFNAQPGSTYMLKVVVNGKEYTAQCTMPYTVAVDSLTYVYKERDLSEAGYELTYAYTDPKDQQNNYLLLFSLNDTLLNNPFDMLLFDDKDVFSGATGNTYYKRLKKGDKVAVVLSGMDEAVYQYFKTLKEILTNQNGPAPANPVTNIRGGALGYFGAFNRSMKEITIK